MQLSKSLPQPPSLSPDVERHVDKALAAAGGLDDDDLRRKLLEAINQQLQQSQYARERLAWGSAVLARARAHAARLAALPCRRRQSAGHQARRRRAVARQRTTGGDRDDDGGGGDSDGGDDLARPRLRLRFVIPALAGFGLAKLLRTLAPHFGLDYAARLDATRWRRLWSTP